MTDAVSSATSDIAAVSLAPALQRSKPVDESTSPATQTIRSLNELEDLRAVWEACPGGRDSDLEYYTAVIRARGDHCEPHVLVARGCAGPEAILGRNARSIERCRSEVIEVADLGYGDTQLRESRRAR